MEIQIIELSLREGDGGMGYVDIRGGEHLFCAVHVDIALFDSLRMDRQTN